MSPLATGRIPQDSGWAAGWLPLPPCPSLPLLPWLHPKQHRYVPKAFLALPTTAHCARMPTPVQQVLTARIGTWYRYRSSPPEQRMLHIEGQRAASPASALIPLHPPQQWLQWRCSATRVCTQQQEQCRSPTSAAHKPLQKKRNPGPPPPHPPLIFFRGFFRDGTHWHSEAHRNEPCVRLSTEIILKVSGNLLFQVSS